MLALTAIAIGCRRKPAVPEATYRQAVTAFYVSLAAMQTSQDVLARNELERVLQLVPDEAAAWANLGLLLLRQQQFDEAAQRLDKAAALAPRNAAIERLRGLNESRNGHLDRSIAHWRRAIEIQDRFIYDEPPPFYYPIRESLGGALLRAGRAADAEIAFREGLAKSPRNGRILFGLMESLRAQGKTDSAVLVRPEFEAAWKRADVTLRVSDL